MPTVETELLECVTYGDECEGWSFVDAQRIGDTRWHKGFLKVFRGPDGLLYGAEFYEGATESQENHWTYPGSYEDKVELRPVEEKTRTITEYEFA